MKEHATMRIPKELIDKIKEQAKNENRSFSNMCEVIIEQHFKQKVSK